MSETAPAGDSVQRPWLLLALLVWALLTLGHGTGLDFVTFLVEGARTPGVISHEGGQIGFLRGERLLASGLGLLFLGFLVLILRRAAPFGARAVAAASPPWFLCAGLAWLAWKIIIVYTTELVHFAQYALIGVLLSIAFGKGRRPQLSFVVAVALGFVDEIWQHYGLHVWLRGEHLHYLDWSDPFLNGIGAFAGVLPAATWLRLRGNGHSQATVIYRATLIAAIVLLPLLLLAPETLSAWFGSYPYYPFWDEHTNLKAVHWVTPYEGIPLLPAFLLVVGLALDPVRRSVPVGALALATLLIGIALQPVSRQQGTPIHEMVPRATVALIDDAHITINGLGNESVWQDAPALGPFLANLSGSDQYEDCHTVAPLPSTLARVLWSPSALYLLIEVEDRDIWAQDLVRDAGPLLGNEGVRVFIDDGGDEVLFFEFAISPANVVADLLQLVPSAPLDYDPWSPTIGFVQFNADSLRSAVHINGSLEIVGSAMTPVTSTVDSGYSVEVRIPWAVFRNTSSSSSNTVRTNLPPLPGQQWRLGLYRLETPRPTAPLPSAVDVTTARQQLRLSADAWRALIDERGWPVNDNSVGGANLWSEHVRRCGGWQAWSPTYFGLRRPERFGVIDFADTR